MYSLLFSFVISSRLTIFVKEKVKEKIKSHPGVVDYFKQLLFYNKHTEKPKIKRLKNINLLFELLFYEELNVIKTNLAFRGYAMSYKVELVQKKDPMKQLETSKWF